MSRHNSERAQAMAKLLEEQQTSGLTMTAFARERGIVPNNLFWWRSKLRRRDALSDERSAAEGAAADALAATDKKPSFLPVRVLEEPARPGATSASYCLTVKGVALTLPERFDVERIVALVRGLTC